MPDNRAINGNVSRRSQQWRSTEMADLREFIDAVQRLDELRVIEDADWDLEIGTMVELNYEQRGPALLFDRIKGHPPGYRILGSPMNTVARSLAALGFPTDLGLNDALDRLDETLAAYRPVPPVEVRTGQSCRTPSGATTSTSGSSPPHAGTKGMEGATSAPGAS
jgi:hypothetical protein